MLFRNAGVRPEAGPEPLVAVMSALVDAHPEATITVLNLPADDGADEALRRVGALVKLRQREMRLTL